MSQSTNTPMRPNKYYLYDDASRIVYVSDTYPETETSLILLGSSDNPSEKMAAAAFLQQMDVDGGFKLRPYTQP